MNAALRALYGEIGARIRKTRERTGLSQSFVATQIDVTRASISNVEAGRQRIPLDRLYQIAAVLQVPVASFLPGDKPDRKIRKALEAEGARRNRIKELRAELRRLSR